MSRRFYTFTRDLHLYLGLFFAPFVLVFAISVFFLVHAWIPGVPQKAGPPRTVRNLAVPPGLERLDGRARVEAVRAVLGRLGVSGEVGFIRHIPGERRLVVPVSVPGREITVDLNIASGTAAITERTTGSWDALVALHKAPGPHLAAIRMNWFPIVVWRWLADSTVYVLLFVSASGVYLWTFLRAERRPGLALIAAGALSFLGVVYALAR